MKLKQLSAMVMTGALLVGCSSAPPKKLSSLSERSLSPSECYFPQSKELAPKWVCSDLSNEDGIYVVGIAEKTRAGVRHQRKIAMLDAKTQIAEKLSSTVSSMVKDFAQTTGAGDAEAVDAVTESVSKSVTHQKLVGLSQKAMAYDKQGRLFILAGINKKNTAKLLKTALATSYKNGQAQWQKFQSEKAFKELNEEVEKRYGNEN